MTNQEDAEFRGWGLSLAWRDLGHQWLLVQTIHNTNLLGKVLEISDTYEKKLQEFFGRKVD